ncbi:MAG TPA: alanine--tRNA ligase [Bacteroidia bacterium]|nr:alanine--tRNA ligase [Bacteroidia bacterium]MBP7714365.1 alanine--tRNA ligase [Bacteroidia bacterium]MBP8668845.1 alanine--tRNA ligase [Bacteroidia bacterium]HOZ82359.1 alanine--tRNA ligase [Bacteroidia bacterium]HOZ89508.1 alanine--tRNA ligase [Bacteroidia bacterium]
MTSSEIRKTFLDFFQSKQHTIVPSAPIVVKGDPTLMFTNAGMNQFKDWFLGNQPAKYRRVADTQKCLRVSGKHNDLEEVGVDTYHHTMFEMLGNWSFGDPNDPNAGYFKKEAIAWAWELLTEVYKLPKDRLYVTVFEGDKKENLHFDEESNTCWKQHIDHSRILMGNKKDNFWEMGDTGPCGPCSEIHVDLRSKEERKQTDGKILVNTGHPLVIEIWNNVFMEFNRKADGTLEKLPARHVDTGMGFERLCMAIQQKKSNYDTDIFQPTINYIEAMSGIKYGSSEQTDIAMRVLSDHIRAIAFTIADGQLPSNNKAGYVIRRILRRAVRYSFTYLNFKTPFIHRLTPLLADQFKEVFPELFEQKDFVQKVIKEEEQSFLRTLETGIRRFDLYNKSVIDGEFAFELYDTYGFPIDLTQLIARERNMQVDMNGFNQCLEQQKERSRAASAVDAEDWVILENSESKFIGYDNTTAEVNIIKYRKVKSKNKEQYQLVFNQTPFYAESGGQVGDTGYIQNEKEKIFITDTQKENNQIIHLSDKLPVDLKADFIATVNNSRRRKITANHSATHLMHAALKQILGKHVVQKGSLVNDEHTRFDFAHFAKVSDEDIAKIEQLVNEKIRENIALDERRNVPIEEAKSMGATALFGEKYGDYVRVIIFDPAYSMELCGGTHVNATGEIGLFKILSESAVAAGVRRIEAITSIEAEKYIINQLTQLNTIKTELKNPKDIVIRVKELLSENEILQRQIDGFVHEKAQLIKADLLKNVKLQNGINVIAQKIDLTNADAIKNISFELRNQIPDSFILLASENDGKAMLSLIISDSLVQSGNLNATTVIRNISKHIQGGGGGQPFYATAGGKNPAGIDAAIEEALKMI